MRSRRSLIQVDAVAPCVLGFIKRPVGILDHLPARFVVTFPYSATKRDRNADMPSGRDHPS